MVSNCFKSRFDDGDMLDWDIESDGVIKGRLLINYIIYKIIYEQNTGCR